MGIVTDSTPLESTKDPDKDTVFKFYTYFATDNERNELADKYRKGGFGYGDAKKLLLSKILEYFKPFREKRIELKKDLTYVKFVLDNGAGRARDVAAKTLDEVREKTGLSLP